MKSGDLLAIKRTNTDKTGGIRMKKETLRRREPAPPSDAGIALLSADAFRNLSKPFLDFLGRNTDLNDMERLNRAVRDLGGMIASATTLSLSVELYLKALRLLTGLEATYTHDLIKLFDGLPVRVKESVIDVYKTLPWPPESIAAALILQLAIGPFQDDQVGERPATDNSLPAVLARSKDAFQTWRYLYERGDHSRTKTFVYEYHGLNNAAEAIRHVALEISHRNAQPV